MVKKRTVHPAKTKKLKDKPKFKNAKSKIMQEHSATSEVKSAKIKNKTITQKPSAASEVKSARIKNKIITNNTSKAEYKKAIIKEITTNELAEKYPVFKNEELVQKFLSVTITNNQKGRIRQILRDSLKGTSDVLLPDVINTRIVAISKATNLTDAELRKIRILYNMLKISLQSNKIETKETKNNKSNKQKIPEENKPNSVDVDDDKKDTTNVEMIEVKTIEKKTSDKKDVTAEKDKGKLKGPKRYVVFIGNLPSDIDKEKIMVHFSDIGDNIVDVRIPEQIEGKKNRIAYLELKNEPTFELALSKHHSMLGNKRINVQYTTQKKTKITKTEAKGKAAKLKALQKSGKLMGSVPANKKRSHRRKKAKAAKAAAEASN